MPGAYFSLYYVEDHCHASSHPRRRDLRPSAAAQSGETAAVEALYDLYADRLYRYLLARTGDPDTAADLTTEVFLRGLKHLGRFRPQEDCPAASLSGWLYRIAGNLAADYHRARRRQPEASLDDQEMTASRVPIRWLWSRDGRWQGAGAGAGRADRRSSGLSWWVNSARA